MSLPCLMSAWAACESELLRYLRRRVSHVDDAEELLQEIFIRALRQGKKFCAVVNPRAWLFQVARHALADRYRHYRETLPLEVEFEELPQPEPEPLPVVDTLSQCLPRILAELSEEDRLAIVLCDIEGQTQQRLANRLGISLPGAKSRLQRARKRLRQHLETACKVRLDANGAVCCFTPRETIAPK